MSHEQPIMNVTWAMIMHSVFAMQADVRSISFQTTNINQIWRTKKKKRQEIRRPIQNREMVELNSALYFDSSRNFSNYPFYRHWNVFVWVCLPRDACVRQQSFIAHEQHMGNRSFHIAMRLCPLWLCVSVLSEFIVYSISATLKTSVYTT